MVHQPLVYKGIFVRTVVIKNIGLNVLSVVTQCRVQHRPKENLQLINEYQKMSDMILYLLYLGEKKFKI